MKKRVVVFTGAGISAQSGIPTFRGEDGLWEGHRVEEVATPEAWHRNPAKVTSFYNERRNKVAAAVPNEAHLMLKEMEKDCDVQIITQNIDDLHERAGSAKVLHLHGEIMKMRSQCDANLFMNVPCRDNNYNMSLDDMCPLGMPWRPHVVWFGEEVPNMEPAIDFTRGADIFLIIGTSLLVYPASSLIGFTPENCKIVVIDPQADKLMADKSIVKIQKDAVSGMKYFLNLWGEF